MAKAMIARVHNYEFSLQAVLSPKPLTSFGIETDLRILGPWRQNSNPRHSNSLPNDARKHEPIQSNDSICVAQSHARQPFQTNSQRRIRSQTSGCNSFIGVEVHHPVNKLTPPQS